MNSENSQSTVGVRWLLSAILSCPYLIIIIIIAVISMAPYLTNKGEHTTLYKINNYIYIKA